MGKAFAHVSKKKTIEQMSTAIATSKLPHPKISIFIYLCHVISCQKYLQHYVVDTT
jgi:hypothetical protein